MHLSLDGVQEAKSSNNTIDAYSVQYVGCRNVYPVRLIKPNNRHKYNEQKSIQSVFNDINSTNLIIDEVICDNPKRSVMRNSLSHSAKYACEYCESASVGYVSKVIQTKVQDTISVIHSQLEELDSQIEVLSVEPGHNERQLNLLVDMKKSLYEKVANEKKN